jgi:GTP pyrophosphokinase
LLQQYSEETSAVRTRRSHNGYGIIVDGLDKAHIKIGNCCQAVHGDEIVGYVSRGNGIIVHRKGCPNIKEEDRERLINLSWDPLFSGKVFETTLKVYSIDRRNGVADMINALNSTKVTISSVTSTKSKTGECITKFRLQVSNLDDLNHVILSIGKISEVYNIERVYK